MFFLASSCLTPFNSVTKCQPAAIYLRSPSRRSSLACLILYKSSFIRNTAKRYISDVSHNLDSYRPLQNHKIIYKNPLPSYALVSTA